MLKRYYLQRRLTQRGDTIVEVLISLAILSMVIGTAYSIANRSLIGSRQAQERSEATKLAESQIESLKAAASTPGAGTPFCMNGASVEVDLTNCRANDLYEYSIVGDANNNYTITINWDRLGSAGREQLIMIYRTYNL